MSKAYLYIDEMFLLSSTHLGYYWQHLSEQELDDISCVVNTALEKIKDVRELRTTAAIGNAPPEIALPIAADVVRNTYKEPT